MAHWASGQDRPDLVEKKFTLWSVGLWAGWEYRGLIQVHQSNTVVTAGMWYSGLVDQPELFRVKKFATSGLWASGLVGNTEV